MGSCFCWQRRRSWVLLSPFLEALSHPDCFFPPRALGETLDLAGQTEQRWHHGVAPFSKTLLWLLVQFLKWRMESTSTAAQSISLRGAMYSLAYSCGAYERVVHWSVCSCTLVVLPRSLSSGVGWSWSLCPSPRHFWRVVVQGKSFIVQMAEPQYSCVVNWLHSILGKT
jgi:hypothetical protein